MTKRKSIPEPPNDEASINEQAAYFETYSPEELIAAGHFNQRLEDDSASKRRKVMAKAELAKRKRAQLNIVFNEEELSELVSYAEAVHIPVSTIAKSWILRALDVEKKRISPTGF